MKFFRHIVAHTKLPGPVNFPHNFQDATSKHGTTLPAEILFSPAMSDTATATVTAAAAAATATATARGYGESLCLFWCLILLTSMSFRTVIVIVPLQTRWWLPVWAQVSLSVFPNNEKKQSSFLTFACTFLPLPAPESTTGDW